MRRGKSKRAEKTFWKRVEQKEKMEKYQERIKDEWNMVTE